MTLEIVKEVCRLVLWLGVFALIGYIFYLSYKLGMKDENDDKHNK